MALGHRLVWVSVSLSIIIIFQIAGFGITGNTLAFNKSAISAQAHPQTGLTGIELLQEIPVFDQGTVETHSFSGCLGKAKPDCSPTLNETSEFLSPEISLSLQIVIPENDHPNSTEQWEDEELKQIMKAFGLRTLDGKPDIMLSQEELSSSVFGPPIPIVQLPPAIDGVFRFAADIYITRFLGGNGEIIQTRLLRIDTFTDTTYLGEADIRNLSTNQVKTIEVSFTVEGSFVRPLLEEEFIFVKSEGCAAPDFPIAHFHKGGAVGCLKLDAPSLPGQTQPDSSLLSPSTTGSSKKWINAAMNEIASGKYFDANEDNFVSQVREFVNDIRNRDGTDWSVVVFVVDGSNDPDGMFADGAIAWTQIGGPYIALTNRLGSYGLANLDAIFVHEFFHAFFALDEYSGAFDEFERSGYFNTRNENHEDAFGGGYNAGDPSIMKRIADLPSNVTFHIQDPSASERVQDCILQDSQANTIAQKLIHKKPSEAVVRSIFGFTSQPFHCDGPISARIFDESQNPPLRSSYVWVDCCFLGAPHKYWQLNIPVNEEQQYRWGTYYWNQFGKNAAIAFEFLDSQGRILPGTYREKPVPQLTNWQFQSVDFIAPKGAMEVVIYPTKCLNTTCKVAADRNYVLTGEWVFSHQMDQFAAEMLGFRDTDADLISDATDTFPAINMEQFVTRITLALDDEFYSSNTLDCLFEYPDGSGDVHQFFGWVTNLDARIVDERGECNKVVDIDILGPDAVIDVVLEPCISDCFVIEPPPGPILSIEFEENADVRIIAEEDLGPPIPGPGTPPTVLIQAIESSVSIAVPLSVTPPDVNGDSDGLTPFERTYAVNYLIGTLITGYAFDVPLINRNPYGSHNNVTINKVEDVEYCVDLSSSPCGPWINANANDRSFNEAGEDFWFVPSLNPGINSILLKATNTVNNLSNDDSPSPIPVFRGVRGIVVNATGPLLTCATLSASKQLYQTKEVVMFTLFNNCSLDTVTLQNSAPWVIKDTDGNTVFTPPSTDIDIDIGPGMSESWNWDQMIGVNEFVSPGAYTVILDTVNAGTYATTFSIVNDRFQKARIGGSIIIDPIDAGIVANALVNAHSLTEIQSLAADLYPPVEPGDEIGTCGDGIIDLNDILVLIEVIEGRIAISDQCGVA